MTDEQLLFITLCVLYLLQCVHWVKIGVEVFRKGARGRWLPQPPSFPLEALQQQAIFAHILPGRGEIIELAGSSSASFDMRAVAERVEHYRSGLRWFDVWCSILFFLLFIAAPVLAYVFGLLLTLPLIIALTVVPLGMIVVRFYRKHRQLYPANAEARWQNTLMMVLYPIAAIRAQDVLTRELLKGFHPLAVARTVCSETAFRAYAEQWLRQADDNATEKSFLRRCGLDPEALISPPERLEGTASYCPRCTNQFTVSAGACSDCGIPLRAF